MLQPDNASSPSSTTVSGIYNFSNDVQFLNTSLSILSNPVFNFTSAKFLHAQKAPVSIVFKDIGKTTLLRFIQFSNAELPMLSNVLERLISRKFVQPEKANPCISLTLSGIVILVKLEHPPKAFQGIYSRPSGNIIFFKLEQPEKHPTPIEITLCGIFTSANLLHPSNPEIYFIPLSMFTIFIKAAYFCQSSLSPVCPSPRSKIFKTPLFAFKVHDLTVIPLYCVVPE